MIRFSAGSSRAVPFLHAFLHAQVHVPSHRVPIRKQIAVGDQIGTRLSHNGLSHLSNELKRHSPVDVTHWLVARVFFSRILTLLYLAVSCKHRFYFVQSSSRRRLRSRFAEAMRCPIVALGLSPAEK